VKDICEKCNGTKTVMKLVFFCTECDKEIVEYKEIDQGTENRYDNIIEYECCGISYSIKLNDADYEERIALCGCSKDVFIAKIELEEQMIQGHFPKEFWNRIFDWYLEVSPSTQKIFVPILRQITQLTATFEMLSAYNIYWVSRPSQSWTTSLAVIIAKKIIPFRKKAYFISMHKLVERSKDFDDKGYLDDLLRNDVIVLDDAFSNDRFFLKTEFVKAQFYNFLKEVIAQDKILICASNVKVDGIAAEYSAIKGLLTANTFEINVTGNLSEAVANEKKKKFEELKRGM